VIPFTVIALEFDDGLATITPFTDPVPSVYAGNCVAVEDTGICTSISVPFFAIWVSC
jgi:hypothetical protein